MPFLEKIGYMKIWGYLFWTFFKFLTNKWFGQDQLSQSQKGTTSMSGYNCLAL